MISLTPNFLRRSMVISRSVRPLISTSALGRSLVRGRRRVPRPAARIMAFMGGKRSGPSQKVLGVNKWPQPSRGKRAASGEQELHRGHREEEATSSFAHFLEFDVAKVYVEAVAAAQTFRELLSEK